MITGFNNWSNLVARGLGAIAVPLLAPWRAQREGQARIIAARADAKVLEIWVEAVVRARAIAKEEGEIEHLHSVNQ